MYFCISFSCIFLWCCLVKFSFFDLTVGVKKCLAGILFCSLICTINVWAELCIENVWCLVILYDCCNNNFLCSIVCYKASIFTPHRTCVSITMGRIATELSVVCLSVGLSVGLE